MSKFSWAVRPSQRPRPTFIHSPCPAKVTLSPITATDLTDAEIGLLDDPFAQESAERAVRAAISYRLKQEAKAGLAQTHVPSVAITVPDAAMSFEDVPADDLAGIAAELRRLVARPQRTV